MTVLQTPTRRASIIKRMLLGRPLATEESGHQLLPKVLALPVFSSDALSSVAYATEEILLVLATAGLGFFNIVSPISYAIAALLFIVVISYRQTVRAYPSGGGAYIVSKENLGEIPGLVAAGSLLVDYVLTVAVSVVAGVAAITSAVPGLATHKVILSIGFIVLITLMNLRGVKESGTLFAIPTYAFIIGIFVMLGVGFAKCAFASCPASHADPRLLTYLKQNAEPFGIFLLLRAFASGCTALTGVEAISNGVPAFKRPSAKNAADTLAIMGAIAITMFVGISLLAHLTHVVPIASEVAAKLGLHEKTVVASIAQSIFGQNWFFYFLQTATALILVLAANTAYQDFPRLSSILARDRYMPRQFMSLGDRLVFSNGIIVLAVLASILVYAFDAEVTRLIQLYVVGVFTSFTLSQFGMVRHWMRDRTSKGWRRSAIINGIGGTATLLVLAIVLKSKFGHGAWIVTVAVPILVFAFRGVHKHYTEISRQLLLEDERPSRVTGTHIVIPVARLDDATLRAIGYARSVRPLTLRAVHVSESQQDADELLGLWGRWDMGFPLEIVRDADISDGLRSFMRSIERRPDEFLTVCVPERLRSRSWAQFLRARRGLLLKAAMLFERDIVVTDIPVMDTGHRVPGGRPPSPTRNETIVLVSNVHNASLRAVAYGVSLRPTDIRAVTFALDEEDTQRMMEDWSRQPFDVPLEILDSPYREVRRPLVAMVRTLRDQAPGTVVTVVVPEFVVTKWWHQFMHNQTALAIKARLLFERDVVVTSIPFHLREAPKRSRRGKKDENAEV